MRHPLGSGSSGLCFTSYSNVQAAAKHVRKRHGENLGPLNEALRLQVPAPSDLIKTGFILRNVDRIRGPSGQAVPSQAPLSCILNLIELIHEPGNARLKWLLPVLQHALSALDGTAEQIKAVPDRATVDDEEGDRVMDDEMESDSSLIVDCADEIVDSNIETQAQFLSDSCLIQ